MMKKIFVSYSRRDMEFVTQLVQDLQQAGHQVWYDLSGLDGGDRWGREIQNAIRQSDALLLVVSPNAVESEWVEKEFLYASNLRKKIVPIMYQACDLPIWLLNIHYVDVQGRNYVLNFSRILRALEEEFETEKHRPAVDTDRLETKIPPSQRQSGQKAIVPKNIALGFGVIAVLCALCIGITLFANGNLTNIIAPFLPGGPEAETSLPGVEPTLEVTEEPTSTASAPVTEEPTTEVPATEPPALETELPVTETPPTETPAPEPTPFGGGGQKIAFVVDNQIWTMNLDGSDQIQLTFPPGLNNRPDWSPDGSKMVFVSTRDGPSPEIYVMNADGTGQTRATFDELFSDKPAWSPDGQHIAFSSGSGDESEIYVMLEDGSRLTRITVNDDSDNDPDWSPDGNSIVFESNRDGELITGAFGLPIRTSEIYVMSADGSRQTRLTFEPQTFDFSPSWSPDGSNIVFVSQRDGLNDIYIMKADGSGQLNLTGDSLTDTEPSWSPDSTMIVYASRTRGTDDIYIMRSDGTIVQRLTNNDVYDIWPIWQP